MPHTLKKRKVDEVSPVTSFESAFDGYKEFENEKKKSGPLLISA